MTVKPAAGDFAYAASLLRDLRNDPRLGTDDEDTLAASIDRVANYLANLGAKP